MKGKSSWNIRYVITTSGYRPPFPFILRSDRVLLSSELGNTHARPWKHGLETCCYLAYKLRYTLCHIYFRLQATIFYFCLTLWSNRVLISPFVLLDSENIGIAIVIWLLSCILAEIRATAFWKPPFWISYFRFLTFSWSSPEWHQ